MQIECPNCRTGYEIDDTALDDGGKNMVCSRCEHKWFQTLEDLQAAIAAAKAEETKAMVLAEEEEEEEIDTSALLDSINENIKNEEEEEEKADELETNNIEEDNTFNPTPPEFEEDIKEENSDDASEPPLGESENTEEDSSSSDDGDNNNDGEIKENTELNEMSAIGAASTNLPPIGSDDLDSISVDAALSEGSEISSETPSDTENNEENPETEGENPSSENKEENSETEKDAEEQENETNNEGTEKKSKVKLNEVKNKIKELTDEQKKAVRKYMIATGTIILFIVIIAIGFTENSHRIPVIGPVYELLGMSEEIPGKGLEFNNVRTIIIKENGAEYIEVKGYILNITKHTVDVPLIQLEIYDKKANLIKETKVAPLKDTLAPGVNINFAIREAKSTDAVRISVTFAQSPEEAKKKSSTKQINIEEKTTEKTTEKPVEEPVEEHTQIKKTEQISK